MALITDPDLLNDGTEVVIDPALKTVQLLEAGNLSEDGATLKAVYSFLKEEWRTNGELIRYDFPMTPITDEQMQIGVSSRNNGWNWEDVTTRELLRTGGWQEISLAGVVLAEYAGIVTLGNLEDPTQVYYQQQSAGASADFVLTGPVNQAVKTYEDGGFDYRSFMKVLAREQGDIYGSSDLAAIGVTTMTYQVYRFPLATTPDIKIVADDIDIDANTDNEADVEPYDGMSITYYDTPQARNIGGIAYNFGIIIDGNSATAEQIYEFVQWSLRLSVDIDAGSETVIGKTADELLQFVGDNLITRNATNPAGGGIGVYIDNFQIADINRISFRDNTGTTRQFPFTATLTLSNSPTLTNDAASIYAVFYTNDDAGDNTGRDFNTSNAIIPRTSDSFETVSRERTSNVATLEVALAHGFSVGQKVEILDVGGDGYNGEHTVLSTPTATTFTYASTEANEANTADAGGTVWKLMAGPISAQAEIQLSYDYDTNDQRGAASAGEDAPITVVAIGLSGAQSVLATGTIARSNANVVALVAPIERNYANP
jgi:hypothetical protein